MALLQVNFYSDVLGEWMGMNVILPQETKKEGPGLCKREDGTYPVLYLLHGMSGDQTMWCRKTSIERYVEGLGLAVVMPTTHMGWYTDTSYGMKYWTYISRELPEICQKMFPQISQKREDHYAAGLSMGGYGAWKMALGAPGYFCAAASLSGALDLSEMVEGEKDSLEQSPEYWEGIFGSIGKVEGSANDLMELARRLSVEGRPCPRLYAWCGTEDFIYPYNVSAVRKLREMGYEVTFEKSPGDHQWKYWDEQIKRVLEWLPLRKGF